MHYFKRNMLKTHLTKKLVRNKGNVTQYYAEGTHPAIIDKETFERAQEIMRRNRIKFQGEQGKDRYVFTSKIECEICGRNFKHKKRGNKHTYMGMLYTSQVWEGRMCYKTNR